MHAGVYAPAPTERVQAVASWIHQCMIERIHAGGVRASSSLQARIYTSLADALIAFEQCQCAPPPQPLLLCSPAARRSACMHVSTRVRSSSLPTPLPCVSAMHHKLEAALCPWKLTVCCCDTPCCGEMPQRMLCCAGS